MLPRSGENFQAVGRAFVLMFAFALAASQAALASLPVCRLSESAKLKEATLVVQARFISAERRYDKASKRQSLVAIFHVTEVLKGNVQMGQEIKVHASCLDKPVPDGMLGYPQARRYCGGAMGANITGAQPNSGASSESEAEAEKTWTLFLDGVGGQYTEASKSSFHRSKCE